MEQNRAATIETLLVSVNRLIRAAAQATGNPTSAAVWRTLGILETDERLRIGELAALSRVAQPTMTKLVASMHADGLVTRTVDPDDSRGQRIAITPAGHDRLATWRATITETVGPVFADLDDDEWATLRDAAHVLASRTAAHTLTTTRTETTA
ncbi:MarR family winged helix-turn-helix transcriptional regulator [Curtobacterium sp. MCBA15_012]|uniref:MarR family winged helix-turn-helix transcriptional regulator n=1 Tax=Curtobacterium sp. MCBA15_012 TaxID=1898738 RepID=UPI0008DD135F|nr:MarR family transcriptional regulator [Curtobacterium sp. MCBA15_012]WIB01080.1 MarR family transcriptional regulator [Curtobacterium sp. MCBA15_012]